MQMKNKLQMHHKNKYAFIMRNFAIALGSILGIGMVISIPTYISLQQVSENPVVATEVIEVDESVVEKPVLTIGDQIDTPIIEISLFR